MSHFHNILVYLRDNATPRDPALERALEFAALKGTSVTVVQVLEEIPRYVDDLLPDWEIHGKIRRETREDLNGFISPFRPRGVSLSADVLYGPPALALVRRVLTHHHDLVLKTAENENSFLGTTANRLMRTCPCPVYVVHPSQTTSPKRILAAVNALISQPEEKRLQLKILDMAKRLATREGTELHVVQAWSAPGEAFLSGRLEETEMALYLNSIASRCKEKLTALLSESDASCSASPRNVHTHFPKGRPARAILEMARHLDAGLIVLGTIARGGVGGFLIGNTAEKVLRQTERSVLGIKPDGFVCPVKA